jgi:indoleamine 2,3-dioxygenase
MRLEDFGIDPVTGFLPKQPPLTRLPDPYYQPWELCIDDISHLLVAWKLRQRITGIPELSIDRLLTEPEQQRAFLLLSLLSHAYVWGAKGEPVVSILPRNLAKPWLKLSAKLGLRPISCHAALVYYNWRLLDQQGPVDLSNLATLHTVSGGIDESWFYLITIAIEAKGAPAMPAILKCLQAAKEQDFASLAAGLRTIAGVISDMTKALERMTENCDPYIFYHRVRIYFSGWSNMKDLPDGLIYEGDEGEIESKLSYLSACVLINFYCRNVCRGRGFERLCRSSIG